MSGNDHFLTRWARRKQAVKDAEPLVEPSSAESEGSETENETQYSTGAAPCTMAEQRDEAAEQPLPRVEDLDAQSEVSAFLRKGVTPALRQAALRRVWALDPAIRDFVSPAEYAWDFNDPNSIPGFSSKVETMELSGFFSGEAERAQVPPPSIATGKGEEMEYDGRSTPEPQHELSPILPASPLDRPRSAREETAHAESQSVCGSTLSAHLGDPPHRDSSPSPSSHGGGEQTLPGPASEELSDNSPRRHGGALPR